MTGRTANDSTGDTVWSGAADGVPTAADAVSVVAVSSIRGATLRLRQLQIRSGGRGAGSADPVLAVVDHVGHWETCAASYQSSGAAFTTSADGILAPASRFLSRPRNWDPLVAGSDVDWAAMTMSSINCVAWNTGVVTVSSTIS